MFVSYCSRYVTLTAACVALSAGPLMAQGVPGGLYTIVLPAGQFGSPSFTNAISQSLGAVKAFCDNLENDAYVVDCLAERLGAVADEIPAGTDYDNVRLALDAASDQLATLAKANRDPDLPRGRASQAGSTPVKTSRPLTPISTANAAQVNRQAIAILEQTETLLLRSPETSEAQSVHYARIAEAVGSNKVLLRTS